MATYAFRTLADRKRIQRMWEKPGCTAKDIADEMGVALSSIYAELKRGQDGETRLSDQRLKYDADRAQLTVQQSFERRGRKAAARAPTR